MLPASREDSSSAMSGLRKAAILMVSVGDELAKILFKSMSIEDVRQVTDEISNLGDVPSEQLMTVLMEFYRRLQTREHTVRGGPEHANRLLTQAFGAERSSELLREVQKSEGTITRRPGDGAADGPRAVE